MTRFSPLSSSCSAGSRPGGNLTGHLGLTGEVMPKRLQLLHELIPNAAAFGVLVEDLQMAARALGLQLVVMNARTDSDLETAFATLSQQRVGAVVVSVSNFYISRMEQLAALAARYKLPASYPFREFAVAGGLMSYGSSIGNTYQRLGIYAGRILKGEKPADLPVEQITKIERVINLKTAKALGLTIPETLLATADEVIQ
jgi:putative ABC transport system substrate-binding protein